MRLQLYSEPMTDHERHVKEIKEEDERLSGFVVWRASKALSVTQIETINKHIDRSLDDRRLLMVLRDSAKVLEETEEV